MRLQDRYDSPQNNYHEKKIDMRSPVSHIIDQNCVFTKLKHYILTRIFSFINLYLHQTDVFTKIAS